MWDLIVSVPDHCLSFYFVLLRLKYAIFVLFHSKRNVKQTVRYKKAKWKKANRK